MPVTAYSLCVRVLFDIYDEISCHARPVYNTYYDITHIDLPITNGVKTGSGIISLKSENNP